MHCYFRLVLALTVLFLFSCSEEKGRSIDSVENENTVENFTLQSASGSVSFADYQGKVVLVFFGYTHCPDICPATMSNAGEALNILTPEERDHTQVLFITVDPDRDSAEYLSEYVAYFHPNMLGLTGTKDAIRKAAKIFMVEFFSEDKTEKNTDYTMIHSSRLFLVDSQGKIADIMSHHTTPDDIASSIRRHLH
ncbi:MAG: SCO family protein [Mariprofundaceae bacterium]